MRPLVLLLVFVAVLGCGPSRNAADETHFSNMMVPKLSEDIKKLLPGSGVIHWAQTTDRSEQDGLAPIPRTVGHSYIAIGTIGNFDVQIEGKYEGKNPDLVFTTIKLTASGSWTGDEFPRNALKELGFSDHVLELFAKTSLDGNMAYVKDGERSIEVQVMASGSAMGATGDPVVVVKRFTVDVRDPKKR